MAANCFGRQNEARVLLVTARFPMARQQLPQGITKTSVKSRRTGKPEDRWRVKLNPVDAAGERHQVNRSFATEREARDFHAETLGAAQAGTYVHASKRTVEQACVEWLASRHSLKPSTKAGYTSALQPVRDRYGTTRLQQLTKSDFDNLVSELRNGKVEGRRRAFKARTVNKMLRVTEQVLKSEQEQGRVVRNVAALVERVRVDDAAKYRTLTEAEMLRVLDHDCRERHLWTLALYGLRRGEVAGLRWANVDLKAGTVTIAEARVYGGPDVGVVVETPKSKKSVRTLPMPADVVRALKAARKQQRAEKILLGPAYQGGEYVACDEAGRPYDPAWISDAWDRMLRDLKIDRVRLHDARHTCGTLMHLRGVPGAAISEWLGHASVAFTMSVYVHSQNDALKAAGAMLRGS
jgi:integrase